ncbi:MAG: histidinol-phosphate aminotransferase family protein [Gemmatimonadetes bacterium]|nr:histidinol-phosphate aminotransferase family protein [Gemmatimonadota bacterium]
MHALGWMSARGLEGGRGEQRPAGSDVADLILLNSNENPYGPASNAIDAVMHMFGQAARYPDAPEDELRATIAAHHKIPVESVILGCGSTEILAFITQALTSPKRRLMTVAPTFETPSDVARRNGVPIEEIRVDGSLFIDLQAMYEMCRGAGLLFICNPNNPTGTMHGIGDLLHFVGQVNARSPESHILIDEAYFEYVDDPTYGTAIPAAVKNPRLIVSRTFSKVYGLAESARATPSDTPRRSGSCNRGARRAGSARLPGPPRSPRSSFRTTWSVRRRSTRRCAPSR